MIKSSICPGRPRGGREEREATPAEALEQPGFGVVARVVAAEAVVEAPRDQQALRGRWRGAEQRRAQGTQRGGQSRLGEVVRAQAENRSILSL